MTALLITHAHGTVERYAHPLLGRLVQPRHYSSVRVTAAAGITWAADNDCFQRLDPFAYYAMLDALKGLPGCRFVCVPDVVADARATAHLFDKWAPGLERRGLPVALVAQDGIERLRGWLARVAHRLSALFIGGSTEWKLGEYAAALVAWAKGRGLWVHMGRVNSAKRLAYAREIGCDSIDGTKWARWSDTHLPTALELLDRPAQLRLEIA